MAEVHYLAGQSEAKRLLQQAKAVAPVGTSYHEHTELKQAPPALAEAITPATFAVVLPNGREFTGRAAVDALRQLAAGVAAGQVQPPLPKQGLLTSLQHLVGLGGSDDNETSPPTPTPRRSRLPRWLRGERFGVGAWIYLRLLAVAYLFAFLSAALQQPALVGEQGIYPLDDRFAAYANWPTMLAKPTLLWWWPSDTLLIGQAIVGLLLAFVLLLNRAPALCSLLCAGLYLSVMNAGGIFYRFTNDGFLVEAGIIGALLAPWTLGRGRATSPPIVAVWLAWILLLRFWTIPLYFRLLFSRQWESLETYGPRLLTDALPTPMGWFLGHVPDFFLELIAALEITIVIFAPLLFFVGRNFRRIGAVMFLFGLLWLFAINNNSPALLISFGLVLLAIDDRFWWGLRRRHPGFPLPYVGQPSRPALPRQLVTMGLCVLLLVGAQMSLAHVYLHKRFKGNVVRAFVADALRPWRIANVYPHGDIFIQDHRREFILEGSHDGQTWKPYTFRYRIGPLDRRPPVLGIYDPRLDGFPWVMGRKKPPPWVRPLIRELLRGNPTMATFFVENPFPDQAPRFIRLNKYRYNFTTLADWQATGNWWQREPLASEESDEIQPPMVYKLNKSGLLTWGRNFKKTRPE